MKRILLIASFIVVISLIGVFALLYHHFFDYEIAGILKNPTLAFTKNQTKTKPSLTNIKHVFVIVEENHDWSTIYNNPDASFINTELLKKGSFAQSYYNIPKNLDSLHPSEPNYIFMESGMIAFSDHTFTTDNPPSKENSTSSNNHLSSLLEKNGYTWKAYQEDISGKDCPIYATKQYAPKHNPFIFFNDVSGKPPTTTNTYCKEHIRPLEELSRDLKNGTVANYTFITPNLQHDMHDGSVAQGDQLLSQLVSRIVNSKEYKKDGLIFITWDEGSELSEENVPIGMILMSPFVKTGYTNTILYSHASYVKTIQEIFGLSPLLGLAADPKTNDLSDFFK